MIRNSKASDLRTLAMLLSNWGKRVSNPDILHNIAFKESNRKKNLDYAILTSKPLIFTRPNIERHCLPKGIEKLVDDDIDVSIKLSVNIMEDNSEVVSNDPILSLGLLMTIDLEFIEDDKLRNVLCSWHLDKDAGNKSLYSHPIYHFNFGGNHMTKRGDTFGDLLLLTGPRIIHPPLDIVLGCDFIIRNFYKKRTHQELTELPAYKTILDSAKLRYWKPFASSLVSQWNNEMVMDNLPHSAVTGH